MQINPRMNKKYWTIFIIMSFILISWSGALDRHSKEYANQSIKEAAITYASARGINAIVSVLQSSQVEVSGIFIGGSIEIGQILDPINDSIERFSEVISIALGSLVLQKILLVVISNDFFKYLLTFFGIFAIWALCYKKSKYIEATLKLFFVVIFVRFSLVFVVATNSIVDGVFLEHETIEASNKLNEFEKALNPSNISQDELLKLKLENENYRNKLDILSSEKNDLDFYLKNLSEELKEPKVEFDNLSLKINDLNKRASNATTFFGKFFNENPEYLKIKLDIERHESRKKEVDSKIDDIKTKIDFHEEGLDRNKDEKKDIETLLRENKNRINGKLTTFEQAEVFFNIDTTEIANGIDDYVNNLFKLLVLYLLKTIFIPVIFFYAFIKMVKMIWDVDWIKVIE